VRVPSGLNVVNLIAASPARPGGGKALGPWCGLFSAGLLICGAIIIWITTALADMIGRRMVRARRQERREAGAAR
jgi:hypothetical protein